MQLIEVNTPALARDFILMPLELYKNDPNWIRPLDQDIEAVFDPKNNKNFRHGEAIRWLMKNEKGNYIGRVAAFFNRKIINSDGMKVGGMGFFECINDRQAAFILFDKCQEWLTERDIEAMDGPINFGERDRFWGCLAEGFTPPVYGMNYNPPYYNDLFQSYGFQLYFKQLCYSLKVYDPVDQKIIDRAAIIAADKNFRSEYVRKNNLKKYAADISIVYNKAWSKHDTGIQSFTPEVVLRMLNKMKPVMDEKLMWLVYYKDEPVAFWLNLPELNFIFRKFNGKLNWWNKLRFIYMLKTGQCTKFIGILFGVVPEFQGKGVDSFIIMEGAKTIRGDLNYEVFEMMWIGDFNPKMMRVAESLGTYISRVLHTYRKIFDPAKPFKRYKVLD
ncbi:MAG: hypothetical protein ACR2GN_10840 [Bacteroidia bacterium]